MKLRLLSVIILVISPLLSGLHLHELEVGSQAATQQGIAYVSWWPGEYSQPDADLALANLRATGANWISLLVTQYQDTITSTSIYPISGTPSDADLIHVINLAHSLGLNVMLKPHVDLADDPTHWHGQIGQGFTEPQWTAWFASYQSFIDHYAQLAQTYGADQFCVGTELSATQNREVQWRTVVTNVRSLYSGPITYAAGWDAVALSWWDTVDYIGVDAYYPLTNKNNPSVAELKVGWIPYTTTLANMASTWGKQVIFTEIGYRSQDGANQHPWDYQIGGTIDLQEQADTYQAAFESVFNQPWFAGMYWWSWGTNPFEGGPCDDGYSPHDKSAEDMLRSWYGGMPRTTSSTTPQPDYSRALTIYTDGLSSGWEDWSYDSTVNLFSTSPVYSGTQAISATIQAWGALSLHYANLDTSPYYWLEFYVREATSGQQLRVFANDQTDSELRYLTVCNYTDGFTIQPGVWARVRVPLADMNAANRLIQRVTIKNYSSQTIQLWIDQIQLIPGTWHIFLPSLQR